MIAFIDQYRSAYGVEPICSVLPIAPSTYHARVHRRANPEAAPARVNRDAALKLEIQRVFDETSAFMVRVKSGGSCSAKASKSPAALWSG
jgi:hypothetical protein